jgi:hypothetical protein
VGSEELVREPALLAVRFTLPARRQTGERRGTSTTRPRCPAWFISPRQRLRAFAFRGLILPKIKRTSRPSCLPCPLSRPQAGDQSFEGLIPPEVGASRRSAAPHPLMAFSLWGFPSHRGGERLPAPSSHALSTSGSGLPCGNPSYALDRGTSESSPTVSSVCFSASPKTDLETTDPSGFCHLVVIRSFGEPLPKKESPQVPVAFR